MNKLLRVTAGLCCLLTLLPLSSARARQPQPETTQSLNTCYAQAEIRTEVVYCLDAALSQADADMTSQFQRAMAQARVLDQRADNQRLATALASAQKAFIQFREQECLVRMELAFPGSGAGDAYRSCMISYAQWRSDILARLLPETAG